MEDTDYNPKVYTTKEGAPYYKTGEYLVSPMFKELVEELMNSKGFGTIVGQIEKGKSLDKKVNY